MIHLIYNKYNKKGGTIMELEKYIEAAKEVIDKSYFAIQDALIKRDEALKKLKTSGWEYSEDKYSELYQEIINTFNSETQTAISACREEVQKQKDEYMKEVSAYYAPDGSKIDLNDMNLIKAGINLSVSEFVELIRKHADNVTMLRVIEKYAVESQMYGKIVKNDHSLSLVLHKVKLGGETEEKIFNSFITLATGGMNHPGENFTLYQARLDGYVEDAALKLLKAKLFIDEETKQRISEIEQKQRDQKNDKSKGKLWGTNTEHKTTITPIYK